MIIKELTFTQYMNRTFELQGSLLCYYVEDDTEYLDRIKLSAFITKAQEKGKVNLDFRIRFFNWMQKGGTVLLRDLSYQIGYRYWESLNDQNIVDTFDGLINIK